MPKISRKRRNEIGKILKENGVSIEEIMAFVDGTAQKRIEKVNDEIKKVRLCQTIEDMRRVILGQDSSN